MPATLKSKSRHFFTPNIVKDFDDLVVWLCNISIIKRFVERFFRNRFSATEKSVFSSREIAVPSPEDIDSRLAKANREIDKNLARLSSLETASSDREDVLAKLKDLQEKTRQLEFLKSEFNLDEGK
jgi:hypothetical protein